MECERRIERVAENIVEIEMSQSFAMGEAVRVHHDECAELFGPYKERPEFRVGQFLAVDIGQDLDAFQLQFAHDVFELAHREFRFLQRDHAEADEPIRLARAVLDDAFIGDPVGRFGYFRINRVVTLFGVGHDLDAHPVEVGQPTIVVMTSAISFSCCALISRVAASAKCASGMRLGSTCGRASLAACGTTM